MIPTTDPQQYQEAIVQAINRFQFRWELVLSARIGDDEIELQINAIFDWIRLNVPQLYLYYHDYHDAGFEPAMFVLSSSLVVSIYFDSTIFIGRKDQQHVRFDSIEIPFEQFKSQIQSLLEEVG